ncbi:meiosis regulator and mRNA stability factor 1 isoform X3 [Girardinichthys multiradiatus]|uniref:meiosis regulator and mRNA stability factor 1 isoform X3 n=1 Tax=Girardinichthys multiradiatus TaxID=208333 RepID=UPI001FAD1316|nr:meiosis regulator and mRNA stability factor 1 isoform X3 [Girardinichthys multiradiatus]
MMDGAGKERSSESSRTVPCPVHPETDVSSLLWKHKDCFSSNETTSLHQKNKDNIYMDNQKAVLDLKDVPPPPPPPLPHYPSTSQLSQAFPSAPLPPACLPPSLQPTRDSHQRHSPSKRQQEGASPKVSICTHCDYCSTDGYGLLGGRGVVGSSICTPQTASNSLRAPIGSSSSRLDPCSVALSVYRYDNLNHKAPDPLLTLGCKPQLPSSVATSQPLSLQPYFPCCSGLHPCSALPLPLSQHSTFPSSAPLSSSVAFPPAPVQDSCLVSSGFYTCGVDCTTSTRTSQRTALCDHPSSTTVTTSTTSAHLYSNPVLQDVKHTVCRNGAHFCQACLLKPKTGLSSESKLWADIPAPPTVPIPLPICNGCGTSSDGMMLMPSPKHDKIGYKYENSVPESIPPVGVFWDIENCSVPSGRSAEAVVQRIRSRFFQGHREAEFICVCDISKESKAVIQELNNCQVTVAHINATAKNAADDKLRQSLRRFADTHTAPATVVLVSSDVNFASELSDLRHRHGFQVILIHGNHTSSTLLQHAHRHVPFQEITADLPLRMLVKSQPRSPRRPRRATRPFPASGLVPERPYSPRRGSSGPPGGAPAKPHQEMVNMETKSRVGLPHLGRRRAASSSPHRNETGAQEEQTKFGLTGESIHKREGSSPRRVTRSPVAQRDMNSGEFKISTPSAFSKLNLNRSFSPLVPSQGSWSSRSGSPCLSSRSSPLLTTAHSSCPEGPAEPFSEGAELQIANLDYRMSRKDLQQILHDTFSRYGQVKVVDLSPHTDYQLKATVQMMSLQQAISAVGALHRYKIGSKRIQVSLVTGGNSRSLSLLSTELICILQDAPANCLPLFKLAEIYEKKFCRKLVIGDLYKLSDVLSVREQGSSRLVCLLPNIQIHKSPLGSSRSQEGSSASGSPVVFEELEYHEPVCRHHYAKQDFSEADFDPESYKIPFVVMSLSSLSSEVHSLLQMHDGTLPLLSFPDCYAAKFSPLQVGIEMLEDGVPLEHLITCVPSITIVTAQNGFKVIKWIQNKPPAQNSEPWIQRCKSPVGNPQLIQFSREIIDLLKSQPSCLLPISKFIPSYHHHFAKQCRVSDYGFSKLLDLLEAVPHVLQIIGMGTKRLLTLTHRAQVKRFTQDLLKLLKFQASKQVAIRDFMQAYHWCFSRDWRVTDYGICDLMDLLAEIPDTTITITHQTTDMVISVPKRDRTVEEMERTKQFGKEVVDLLRHQPHCRMPFSKFIPTYHHHFGRQCKLSYYGFTKLMELLEAIPDILMVLECGEEKVLILTEVERIKALAAQLVKLLRAQKNFSLSVSQLLPEYNKTFGYGLRLQDYDAAALPALLAKLCHVVKVVDGSDGREVQLINRKSLRLLTTQLLALLMSQENHQLTKGMKVEELSQHYLNVHGTQLNPCEYGFLSLSELLKSLPYLVELYFEESDENCEDCSTDGGHGVEWVRLTKLYQFARNVRALLHTYHYNQIFLTEFQGAYSKFTGCSFEPCFYGCVSVDELLSAIPQVVWIKGHGHKRIIVLKNDMKAKPSYSISNSPQPQENAESLRDSPISSTTSGTQSPGCDADSELLRLTSPVDLLCGPVPSCLPSPQLHPDPVLQQMDLIDFEKTPPPQLPTEPESVEEAAADGTSDPPEQPGWRDDSPPLCDEKNMLSMDSPGRRVSRSRFKLAANFSFTTGL